MAFTEYCRYCRHFEIPEHGTICHAGVAEKASWYVKCKEFSRNWKHTIGYLLIGETLQHAGLQKKD